MSIRQLNRAVKSLSEAALYYWEQKKWFVPNRKNARELKRDHARARRRMDKQLTESDGKS